MHRLQEVVRLHRRGHSARRIARLLRMDRDTIRAYLVALEAGGLLDGDQDELPELEVLRACVESQTAPKPLPSQQRSTIELWAEADPPAAQDGGTDGDPRPPAPQPA